MRKQLFCGKTTISHLYTRVQSSGLLDLRSLSNYSCVYYINALTVRGTLLDSEHTEPKHVIESVMRNQK